MTAAPRLRIKDGSIYLDAAVYERYFRRIQSIAVVLREQRILLLPLRTLGSGGSIVKLRNARGDRVIHAREFLRGLDLDDPEERELEAEWDPELTALSVPNPKA